MYEDDDEDFSAGEDGYDEYDRMYFAYAYVVALSLILRFRG